MDIFLAFLIGFVGVPFIAWIAIKAEAISMATKLKGGPSADALGNENSANGTTSTAKTVTLSFSTEAEIALYNKLSAAADEDERSLSRFLVRKLKSMSDYQG